MDQFCLSCGIPLNLDFVKPRGDYCQNCTTEDGALISREAIQKGIAEWLKQWAPDKTADFMKRADNYLKAMPAWAEK